MKNYIYYEKGSNKHDEDVALVQADSLGEAIEILSKYFSHVNKTNVCEIIFKDFEGKNTNILIFSDY